MRRVALRAALVAALLLSISQVASREVFRFREGDVGIKVVPAIPGGRLTLTLGPFGDLRWSTHTAPVNIEVGFLIRPAAGNLPDPERFRDLRWAFLLRKLPWLVASGALIGALTVGGRATRRRWVVSSAGGAAAVTLFALGAIGAASLTFRAGALRHPRYVGPIQDAPRVLQLMKEVQRDWQGVQRNINAAVDGLQRLHDQIVAAAPAPASPDTVRLLIVSDLHNNPLGMMLANELADRFDADAILDAGDFTDRGTQIEAELFARFQRLDRPYLIAPGNHEDRPTLDRLAKVASVRILRSGAGDIADVGGITILGADDPNARSIDSNPRNAVAEREFPARCEALLERTQRQRPHVVLVHNQRLGDCVADWARAGEVPLVYVWGHNHRQSYTSRDNVQAINPGTSGANGIKTGVATTYGFALAEFDPAIKAPVSICLFAFEDPSRLSQTTCHIAPFADAAPAPTPPTQPRPSATPP